MNHGSLVLAALAVLAGPAFSLEQGALPTGEIAPGIFVHAGATALMTRENEGAIANVGFIIGSEQSCLARRQIHGKQRGLVAFALMRSPERRAT